MSYHFPHYADFAAAQTAANADVLAGALKAVEYLERKTHGVTTGSFTVPAVAPYVVQLPVAQTQETFTITVGGAARRIVSQTPGAGEAKYDWVTGRTTFNVADAGGAAAWSMYPAGTAETFAFLNYYQAAAARMLTAIRSSVSVIGSVSGLNAKTTGAQTIFTAAANYVVTAVVIRATAAAGVSIVPTVGVGVAAGEDDIMPPAALDGLTATGLVWAWQPSGLIRLVSGGDVVKIGIDAPGVASGAYTLTAEVLGYAI